jgi:hypothetical protein
MFNNLGYTGIFLILIVAYIAFKMIVEAIKNLKNQAISKELEAESEARKYYYEEYHKLDDQEQEYKNFEKEVADHKKEVQWLEEDIKKHLENIQKDSTEYSEKLDQIHNRELAVIRDRKKLTKQESNIASTERVLSELDKELKDERYLHSYETKKECERLETLKTATEKRQKELGDLFASFAEKATINDISQALLARTRIDETLTEIDLTDFVQISFSIRDMLIKNEVDIPKFLEIVNVAPDIAHMNQVKTLMEKMASEITNIKRNSEIDPDEKELLLQQWEEYREREFARIMET